MIAFLYSMASCTFAEVGDKTQFLSFLLAIRLRKPIPILCGILVANFANHMLSVEAGALIGASITGSMQLWILGLAFGAMAVWMLIPDRLDNDAGIALPKIGHLDAFVITALSYFFAEIGDKTQIAAVVLGARFETLLPVALGTTTGVIMADLPVVLGGCWIGRGYAPSWTRYVAATIFCLQAVFVFAGQAGG